MPVVTFVLCCNQCRLARLITLKTKIFNCYFVITDNLGKVEKKRNELSKSNFNDSMTEEDKKFLEMWRQRNQKIPAVKRSKMTQSKSKAKKKATALESTHTVTCIQENVDDQSNSPSNFSFGIASGTEPPAILPGKNLSSAANPSVSNSVAFPTAETPLSSSSSSNPAISVANRNSASTLPSVISSLASVSQSFATTSNSNILSILPLVTSSFNSTDTAQSSESPTLNSNRQPLTHLNLSVPSDNLTYSSFLSGLQPTSETTHTAVDVSSFSLESTNSNTFSFSRPSFDSVGQTEFRVSSPVRSGFQAGFSAEEIFPPSRSPSNINNLLPGHLNPESPPTVEQINSKVDNISEKLDAVLANQRLIIDCLQNNGFMNNTSHSSTPTPRPTNHNTKELTTEELQTLKNTKKKGTTDAYFAVMLLKKYTTDEERMNCTVHGEGRKSKGLNKEALAKIKKGYETIFSNESWSDAINAMNSHLRKYCSNKDN